MFHNTFHSRGDVSLQLKTNNERWQLFAQTEQYQIEFSVVSQLFFQYVVFFSVIIILPRDCTKKDEEEVQLDFRINTDNTHDHDANCQCS
jgi:hypothetical protein